MNKEIDKDLNRIKRIIKKKFPKKNNWTFCIILWEDKDYSIEGRHGDKLHNLLKIYYKKSIDKLEINEDKLPDYNFSNWKLYLKNLKEIIRDGGISPDLPTSKKVIEKVKKVLKNRKGFIELYRDCNNLYLDKDFMKSIRLDYKNMRIVIKNNPRLSNENKKKLIKEYNKLEQKKKKKNKEHLE